LQEAGALVKDTFPNSLPISSQNNDASSALWSIQRYLDVYKCLWFVFA